MWILHGCGFVYSRVFIKRLTFTKYTVIYSEITVSFHYFLCLLKASRHRQQSAHPGTHLLTHSLARVPDGKLGSKSKQPKEARMSMLSKMTRASETVLPAADGASSSGSGGRLSRLSLFGSSPLSLNRKVAVDSSNNEGISGEEVSDEDDEVVQELSDRGVSSSPSHGNTAVHSSQQGTTTTTTTTSDDAQVSSSGDAQVSSNGDAQVSSIRAASATTTG